VGHSIQLTTNIESRFVTWKEKSSGVVLDSDGLLLGTIATPDTSIVYQAWVHDSICGDVFEEVNITVQTLPNFKVNALPEVYEHSQIILSASPNASWWTDLNGVRVFNPITIDTTCKFIGWYTFEACTVSDTVQIDVKKRDTFGLILTGNGGCFDGDGWANVTVNNGFNAPYTFRWSNGSTDTLITNLPVGMYWVSVANADSSRIIFDSIVISLADSIRIGYTIVEPDKNCEGAQINTIITGGIQPYDYHWDDGSIAPNRTNLSAGIHVLTVIDAIGCENTATVQLSCSHSRVMPSLLITPDGDGKNDVLKIENIDYYPKNRVIIINTYGEEIARIHDYNNTTNVWDGKHNNKTVPAGTYYYIVEVEGLKPMAGWLLMELTHSK
jgi:gliding motility-associated-like protein